jgi:hypothetical protein
MPTDDGSASEPSSPARNAQYPWDEFAAADYHDHNYLELREDDAEILGFVASWFADEMRNRSGHGLDVGAGPNLYPTLAMLPHCGELTLREYSAANVEWLAGQTADLPEHWRPYWDVVSPGSRHGDFTKAHDLLAERVHVERGSIFELPEAAWDLGTMFFVAESISQDPAEFRAAAGCFVRALRHGAPFAAAFMEQSDGYDVAGVSFPATPVGAAEITDCLGALASDVQVHRVEMRPAPLRPGYTGMLVAVGRAR